MVNQSSTVGWVVRDEYEYYVCAWQAEEKLCFLGDWSKILNTFDCNAEYAGKTAFFIFKMTKVSTLNRTLKWQKLVRFKWRFTPTRSQKPNKETFSPTCRVESFDLGNGLSTRLGRKTGVWYRLSRRCQNDRETWEMT